VGVLSIQGLLAATVVRSIDATVVWCIFDTIIMLDVVTTFT
jgi:hypothetical protein